MTTIAWELPVRATIDPRSTRAFATPAATFSHYDQIAGLVDQAGFDRLYVPFDPAGDDSIILTGRLVRETQHVRIVTGLHPGAGSPVYLAKLFSTIQRAARGRLDLHIAERAPAAFDRSIGVNLTDAQYRQRLTEFVDVLTSVWHPDEVAPGDEAHAVDRTGEFFSVVRGGLTGAQSGKPFPTIILDPHAVVASPAPTRVLEPVGAGGVLRETSAVARSVALSVIVRDDDEEAWADAAALWQRGGTELGRTDSPWVSGFTALGLRHDVGLVGGPETVTAALAELQRAGADEFVFTSPFPIDDILRVAERVAAAVRATGAEVLV